MSKEKARIAALLTHKHMCTCDFDTLSGQEQHETEMRKLAALLQAAEDAATDDVPEAINTARKPSRKKTTGDH